MLDTPVGTGDGSLSAEVVEPSSGAARRLYRPRRAALIGHGGSEPANGLPGRSSGIPNESKGRSPGVSAQVDEDLLNGARVLVVEDEAAISMLLEDMLLDFGCTVVGPAARLSTALEMAETESFEVAILDVNVAGEPIYPVAEAIVKRNLPIVFSTGYGGAGIREPFRDRPVVQKPFSQADLKRTLIAAVAAAKA
ncbi:CheY-like chemotaxis protein [Methylobacterium goesingense]|uniref:CheY-like chemotaxis protein n=1 Tax=Methylobacterium goesingense TaxID=243690 RepID=A0ABV2L0Z5_9HYPH